MYMLSEQRYHIILDLLEKNAIVKTHALCQEMGTTRETIRRDLMALEEKGLLKRIRGGAMKPDVSESDANGYMSFDHRRTSHLQYKECVVQEALKTIHDGQVIAFDSGTTDLMLAKALVGAFHSLTVVTNSLAIANELAGAKGIELIVTGGVYRADEEAFVSGFANLIFPKIHIDTFYLTTCGISVEAGITYQRMDEISVQTQMMEVADHTIVIADSSKLGANSLVRMCGIEKISALITDYGVSPTEVGKFEKAGVRVMVAPERSDAIHEQADGT